MNLYYTDVFELPLPEKHRFPMSKYRLLRDRLRDNDRFENCHFKVPHAASDHQLLLAHTPDYLNKITTGNLTKTEVRRIGFPWSLELIERSRRSTGATICAARDAMKDFISVNLAGGTHHSFSDSAEGYCVFNDACVAARVLQREKRIERALIIDLDVHQGNGTAEIVSDDNSIFAFSMHCEKNFPFRKQVSDLDLALPAEIGDDEYLHHLKRSLEIADQSFRPDIVFYLAGADPFEKDRLGKLKLTKPGLARRDETVFRFCKDRQLPVVVAMAGGYATEIEDIVDIHAATIRIGKRIICDPRTSDVRNIEE